MFKVNNKDTRATSLTLLLTLTYFTYCSSVSIVNFEQVNDSWVIAGGYFLGFSPS